MDFGSLPLWAQNLSAIVLTLGTALSLRWAEKRKEGKSLPHDTGDAQVVAASFVEKRLMERLIEVVAALHTQIVELNGHAEKFNDRQHEDDLVRAAVARMKGDRQ